MLSSPNGTVAVVSVPLELQRSEPWATEANQSVMAASLEKEGHEALLRLVGRQGVEKGEAVHVAMVAAATGSRKFSPILRSSAAVEHLVKLLRLGEKS